jgi:DNA-binding transcriptional ArsR family regulator
MDTKKDTTLDIQRLSNDSNYYNNVFKKTEKILSVTLYILSETDENKKTLLHTESIKEKALKTQEAALQTLPLQPHEQTNGLVRFQYQLVAFESALSMAKMSGVLAEDIFNLLHDQLDGIHRYINNHYIRKSPVSVADLTETVVQRSGPTTTNNSAAKPKAAAAARRSQRVQIPAGDISTDAYLVYSQLTDRAERIKTVLEAKPQATIKDIAEVITDVSEKTIQRELNSLIEKGQVIREGERRWSRYSIQK